MEDLAEVGREDSVVVEPLDSVSERDRPSGRQKEQSPRRGPHFHESNAHCHAEGHRVDFPAGRGVRWRKNREPWDMSERKGFRGDRGRP